MDDDGDYFTWTLEAARAVLTERKRRRWRRQYGHQRSGGDDQSAAKNVLMCGLRSRKLRAAVGADCGTGQMLGSAKKKMYAARLQRRPRMSTGRCTADGACVSAYLEAAKVLNFARLGGLRCGRWTGCGGGLETLDGRRGRGRPRRTIFAAVARRFLFGSGGFSPCRRGTAGRLCVHDAGLPGRLRARGSQLLQVRQGHY